MELMHKTPAQLLQEYQSKHRGISINYVTQDIQDAKKRNKFKVIASAGSQIAEVDVLFSYLLSHKIKLTFMLICRFRVLHQIKNLRSNLQHKHY